ncbi:hypothetical protein C2E21_5372 [Chlorella sorokiniana]|uniref:Uncharacterized protein n=1 Tax=Chlorella sorokiniana TaxID=3076 RepID=A0A2P6TNH0_CHLSO|nr:hypothetical protein C2E21_5372 [Chlorella sorokiniana]|eukprot:PRW50872.1 hypothetical protein C2E21_5372 [Chlorella sorokiniana]
MAKRFRDESEASQVLTETGAKRLKGDLPENEGAWEGLAAGKLAAVPLPGQHPYLAAPLRPANSAADAPDQPQQQGEQQSSPQHPQQQQEQQPSLQQSPQHWQQHPQPQHPLNEAALAAAAGSVDWNNPQQVNAFLGWLHHERLRRHGQQPEQQQQQHPGAA